MNTRINQNSGVSYTPTRGVGDNAPTARGEAGKAAGVAQDRISLSADAERVASLTQLAKASPDVNSSRVEAIKAEIARGDYQIDAKQLAGSMLSADRLFGR